jgi:hypothetical protein
VKHAVEVNKELISSTLRKLPWLNLSVNTISQNLSQHEVKMLLRYKNIDVNSAFGSTVKKTVMCETLLRVLQEDQFKEEMRQINAPGIPSASASASAAPVVSLVGDLAVRGEGTASSIAGQQAHITPPSAPRNASSSTSSMNPVKSTTSTFTTLAAQSTPLRIASGTTTGSGQIATSTVLGKAPTCQVSVDFLNNSKWTSTSMFNAPINNTAATTGKLKSAAPSVVYFRDRALESSDQREGIESNASDTSTIWKPILYEGIYSIDQYNSIQNLTFSFKICVMLCYIMLYYN